MGKLAPVTHFIDPNEKAFALEEVIMTPLRAAKTGYNPPEKRGRHRYQIIGVIRGGQLALHYTDMGESKNYTYGGIRLPALFEHTVAELRDMADTIRSDDSWEQEIIKNRQGEIGNFGEHLDRQYETAKANLANRTVVGPLLSVARNGRTWKGAANVR